MTIAAVFQHVLTMVVLFVAGGGGQASTREGGGALASQPRTICHAFGAIEPRERILIEIPIVNDTPLPVELISARPGCTSCTRVVSFPSVIEPEQTRWMTVELRPAHRRGPVRFSGTLLSPDGPFARFEIGGTILGIKHHLRGDSVFLGPSRPGQRVSRLLDVDVYCHQKPTLQTQCEDDRFELIGLQPAVRLPDTPTQDSPVWRFTLRASFAHNGETADGALRRARATIHLHQNRIDQATPEHTLDTLTLDLLATVASRDRVRPARLFLGEVDPGTVEERLVTLPIIDPDTAVHCRGGRLGRVEIQNEQALCRILLRMPAVIDGVCEGMVSLVAGDQRFEIPWMGFNFRNRSLESLEEPRPPDDSELTVLGDGLAAVLDGIRQHAALKNTPISQVNFAGLITDNLQPDRLLPLQRRSLLRYLGDVRAATWPASLPRTNELCRLLKFKRDCILASTSTLRQQMFASSEIVVPPGQFEPAGPTGPATDLHHTQSIHRAHAGSMRFTAMARVLDDGRLQPHFAIASDGRSTIQSFLGQPPHTHASSGYDNHQTPAEWESIACLLGSIERGTARSRDEDLTAGLEEAGSGLIDVSHDSVTRPGRKLVRVQVGTHNPWTIWLDPELGLGVVQVQYSDISDSVHQVLTHSFSDFEYSDVGLWWPRRIDRVQHRRNLDSSPEHVRVVFRAQLTCLGFQIHSAINPQPPPLDSIFERHLDLARRRWLSDTKARRRTLGRGVVDESHPPDSNR